MAGQVNYGPHTSATPRDTTANGIFHLTHYEWGSGNVEWPYIGSLTSVHRINHIRNMVT